MKTMIVVILICMLLLFLLKVPVYISMALTGCALMVATSGMKWSILTQYLYTGKAVCVLYESSRLAARRSWPCKHFIQRNLCWYVRYRSI